ncbi:MAG TPA: hypothetical protein VN772_06150 [Solirubrobacteraceae bacterium]|nr:hypothetical protein [Solirubrobacteraceae bacterium]
MRSFFSRKLTAAAVVVVVLGGGAAAFAATQGSAGSGRQAYLDDVAGHLGVSSSALAAAIKAADVDRIDAAVAAGRMSRSRAEVLKARIQQSATAPLFAFGAGAGRGGARVGVAARYLGISPEVLRSDRLAGKSLAQIAASTPGKSADGLKAAVLAADEERLASAVSNGRITAQQESRRLKKLAGRVEAMLQRTGVKRHRLGSVPGPLATP